MSRCRPGVWHTWAPQLALSCSVPLSRSVCGTMCGDRPGRGRPQAPGTGVDSGLWARLPCPATQGVRPGGAHAGAELQASLT